MQLHNRKLILEILFMDRIIRANISQVSMMHILVNELERATRETFQGIPLKQELLCPKQISDLFANFPSITAKHFITNTNRSRHV